MTEERCGEIDRLLATLEGMQGIGNSLYRLEYVVRHLIDNNFVQVNKGTQMAHATWDDICDHIEEEFGEFVDSFLPVDQNKNFCHTKEEVADLLALLVHAALKAGSNMAEIERLACDKMARRFKKTLD